MIHGFKKIRNDTTEAEKELEFFQVIGQQDKRSHRMPQEVQLVARIRLFYALDRRRPFYFNYNYRSVLPVW